MKLGRLFLLRNINLGWLIFGVVSIIALIAVLIIAWPLLSSVKTQVGDPDVLETGGDGWWSKMYKTLSVDYVGPIKECGGYGDAETDDNGDGKVDRVVIDDNHDGCPDQYLEDTDFDGVFDDSGPIYDKDTNNTTNDDTQVIIDILDSQNN